MKYKKIGLEKPIYIFILVFIICLSYTVLSYNPPEQKLHPIDSIDNDEPLNINMVENINTSTTDDNNIESVKVNEVITNET